MNILWGTCNYVGKAGTAGSGWVSIWLSCHSAEKGRGTSGHAAIVTKLLKSDVLYWNILDSYPYSSCDRGKSSVELLVSRIWDIYCMLLYYVWQDGGETAVTQMLSVHCSSFWVAGHLTASCSIQSLSKRAVLSLPISLSLALWRDICQSKSRFSMRMHNVHGIPLPLIA